MLEGSGVTGQKPILHISNLQPLHKELLRKLAHGRRLEHLERAQLQILGALVECSMVIVGPGLTEVFVSLIMHTHNISRSDASRLVQAALMVLRNESKTR